MIYVFFIIYSMCLLYALQWHYKKNEKEKKAPSDVADVMDMGERWTPPIERLVCSFANVLHKKYIMRAWARVTKFYRNRMSNNGNAYGTNIQTNIHFYI